MRWFDRYQEFLILGIAFVFHIGSSLGPARTKTENTRFSWSDVKSNCGRKEKIP